MFDNVALPQEDLPKFESSETGTQTDAVNEDVIA